MNFKKLLYDYGSRLALLCAALALLLFIPACVTESTGLRVFLIIVIVLLLGGGGTVLFLSTRGEGNRLHYFLYDKATKRSIPREELTAKVINARTTQYLQPFSRSPLSLWENLPDSLKMRLEAQPAYGPLVMYSMLSALANCPDRHVAQLFAKADPKVVSYLCNTIGNAGDGELADYIFELKKKAGENANRVSVFFKKNAPTFSARSVHYVQKNFERFYVNKAELQK